MEDHHFWVLFCVFKLPFEWSVGLTGEADLFLVSIFAEPHYWQGMLCGSLQLVTMGNIHLGQIRNKLIVILMPAENPSKVPPVKSKHGQTKANLFLPVCLPQISVGLCGMLSQGWTPSLSHEPVCPRTHTQHLDAHTRCPRACSLQRRSELDSGKPGRSQPSQAEWSLAHLESEDVNRDRATASGQAQQHQMGLQEER